MKGLGAFMSNESLSNEINNIGVLSHEEMILQKCFLKLSFFLNSKLNAHKSSFSIVI